MAYVLVLLQSLLIALLVCAFPVSQAQDPCAIGFTLPEHYHNGMVLQGDRNIQVWGFVDETCEDMIEVSQICGSRIRRGTAQFEGPSSSKAGSIIFTIPMASTANGEECTLEFRSSTSLLTSLDVIYGDVWICSGQSNMELFMSQILNATEEIAASAAYTNIRMYAPGHKYSDVPLDTLDENALNWDGWYTPDDEDHLKLFAAVCFLYARELTDRVVGPDHVFGLIGTYYGGTFIEPWCSPETIATCGNPPNIWFPDSPQNDNTVLYNGMIYPFMRDPIYGVLWYQGESNGRYHQGGSNYSLYRTNGIDIMSFAWLYRCTFYTMIDDWRKDWTMSDPKFPFGFVQIGPDVLETGVRIRWHQTNDTGTVTDPSLFMAISLDTYDNETNIHPRNKQIVAERLSIAGGNVAYRQTELPTNGPFPDMTIQAPILTLEYPNGPNSITYDNTEISGFYACCNEDYDTCDATLATGQVTSWTRIDKGNVAAYPEDNIIYIDYSNECAGNPNNVTGLAYLWEDVPVKGMTAAPIYSNDQYRLPAAPWTFCLKCS